MDQQWPAERPIAFRLFEATPDLSRRPLWLFFDADWYARRYRTDDPVRFYRDSGARLGHSPNRLFDEAWYRARNHDVREAIASGLFASAFEHYCDSGYVARSPSPCSTNRSTGSATASCSSPADPSRPAAT